jgi:Rrf2 family protein
MHLSTKGRYSLEAMLYLASVGVGRNGKEISQAVGIPSGYLAQLMMPLRRDGLVTAQRGASGCYALGRSGITCGEILLSAGEERMLPCHGCGKKEGCATERLWDDLASCVDQVLSLSIEELASSLLSMQKGAGL